MIPGPTKDHSQDSVKFSDIVYQVATQLEDLRHHGYGSINLEIVMNKGVIEFVDVQERKRFKYSHQICEKT